MQLIALLILCLATVGCEKNVAKSEDVDALREEIRRYQESVVDQNEKINERLDEIDNQIDSLQVYVNGIDQAVSEQIKDQIELMNTQFQALSVQITATDSSNVLNFQHISNQVVTLSETIDQFQTQLEDQIAQLSTGDEELREELRNLSQELQDLERSIAALDIGEPIFDEGIMRSGSLQLPADAGMLAEELQVVSVYEEVTPDTAGNFDIAMAETTKQQFVAVIDPDTDNPLLLGYVDPIQSEHVDISFESTAVGLVFLNPLMIFTTVEQRSEFMNEIKAHPNFSLLVNDIETNFQTDPQNTLDIAAHPELYQQAVEIAIDVWQGLAAAGKLLAQDENPSVPWIEDKTGNTIAFVNPTFIYYAAGISTEGQLSDIATISPKPQFISFGWQWPPVYITPEERTDYELRDGDFEIYLTKGYQFESFFNWDTPDGRASMINTAALALHMIDLIGLSLPHLKIPRSALKLDEAAIAISMNSMRLAYRTGDQWGFMTSFIGMIASNADDILVWLGEETVKASKSQKLVRSLLGLAKNAAAAIKIAKAANVQGPFIGHLIFADSEVRYSFLHEDGVILERKENTPPIPDFRISPIAGVIGTTFTLDALNTEDADDEFPKLVFRWDWENDGVWDTEWLSVPYAEHSFDQAGSYSIVLQVRDTNGSTQSITKKVSVGGGQGTANHIKLFRDDLPWDSNAMLDLFNALGFTEGTGANTYELLTSQDMRSAELIPGQDLVVISNDQPQSFYNNYAQNQLKFINFVDNGGTLFWGACDEGWSDGSIIEAGINLPGGVEVNPEYEDRNLVVDGQSLPLVSGLPESLTGSYASHEWFSNLPDGTVIYTIGNDSGKPTLIEFSWGAGWVIMTGQPLEWGYDRRDEYSMGFLLDRVVAYVLGVENQAGKIVVPNPLSAVVDRDRPSSEVR